MRLPMKPTPRLASRSRLAVLLAVCGCLCACRTPPPLPPSLSPPASLHLLDGFEDRSVWSLDSADNYGSVERVSQPLTEGVGSARLVAFDSGRGKTLFRREVIWDLSRAQRLVLDVRNETVVGAVGFALALQTEAGGFYETEPRPLVPGHLASLEVPLDGTAWKAGFDPARWAVERASVRRMLLLVYPPAAGGRADVSVDNLRCDRPDADRAPVAVVLAHDPLPARVDRFAVVELRLRVVPGVDAAGTGEGPRYRDPGVRLRLDGPAGRTLRVRGFMLREPAVPGESGEYGVRFSLEHPGLWQAELSVDEPGGGRTIARAMTRCEEAVPGLAPVRVDPTEPRRFADATGRVFVPFGQNVCWASDYTPYLDAMQRYGGNWMRVWLCPWNHPLLVTSVDRIELGSAAEVDALLHAALARGIHVQLVLAYHGWLGADWGRNPFRAAAGGPCPVPESFWISRPAQQAFEGLLQEVVARWAAFPNLFAWELMNEADLTPRYRDEDIVAWHRRMGAHLQRIDPWQRMITTSTAAEGRLADLWALPSIAFTGSHLYGVDVEAALHQASAAARPLPKPWFVQEIGRGWQPHADQVDRLGHHLQAALWGSWMTPGAGVAMPWWWDTAIEAYDLTGRFAALGAFARDEAEGRAACPLGWRMTLSAEGGRVLAAQGLIGRDRAYGWIWDPARVNEPVRTVVRPLATEPMRLQLRGLAPGAYRVAWWDCEAGALLREVGVDCADGTLTLDVGVATDPVAFKLTPMDVPALEVVPVQAK